MRINPITLGFYLEGAEKFCSDIEHNPKISRVSKNLFFHEMLQVLFRVLSFIYFKGNNS